MLNAFKKLRKYDYITVAVFLIGFMAAAIDLSLMNAIVMILDVLNKVVFWSLYFISFLWIAFTIRVFVLNGQAMRLSIDNPKFDYAKLILIGYYLGFIINISNAFVLSTFHRFVFFGVA
jgi:hypothetical protein